MSNQVIEANENSIDELSKLLDAYRQFYRMPSDIALAREFLLARFLNKESKIFLYIRSSVAVGFVQIYPQFSSLALQPTWLLNDLFVKEEARRQGIAEQLITHVLEQAKINNVFSVKLVTAKSNTIAKHLYETLGFRINNDFDSYSVMVS